MCVAHGLTLAVARPAFAPGAVVVSGCGRGADSIPGGLGTCRDDLPPELPPSMLEYPAVKSALETLNPTRVKLTVEVPFEELKPSLDAAYKTIASQISVPGFRKGKVPAADHRPAGRPRRRAAGGRQRGPAALLRPGRRGEQGPPARPARGRRHRRARRGRPGAEVHRRGRRAPRARAARLLRADRRGRQRRRRGDRGRRGGAPHHAAPALRHADRRRARRRRRATSSRSTSRPRSATRRSTRSRASPTRSAPAT